MQGFPLIQAGNGEQVEIVAVHGGGGVQRRLYDLGLVVGRELEVVARQPGGPVLVALSGARIAVGFGMAAKVKVRPLARRRDDG